jgi:methylated-DNA-[protein]-cysteine S-methyltransferase
VRTVRFHLQQSPVGRLLVAATDAGVCLVDWGDHDSALERLERALGVRARRASLGTVDDQLQQYFCGRRRYFDVAVDLSLVSPFRRAVLERVARVPFGSLTTYGALARALKSGPRAIGQAVGSNPVPVLVPCHRVIAANGTLGGFGGGLSRKRTLLGLEGHADLGGRTAPRRAV